MMKNKKRALRRHHERRVQKKRWLNEISGWLGSSTWKSEEEFQKWKRRRLARYKSNHIGCGCNMCKPWKWGWECPDTHSDKKRLMIEDDEY